jgi:hypothetical protein
MEEFRMSPEAVVQHQLDAYNERSLERFVALYDEGVRVFRPPAPAPTMVGRAALADFYATQRFNLPHLHAQLVNRIVLGNKVIDHERVTGVGESAFEVAAVYEVVDGLIRTVWFYSAA